MVLCPSVGPSIDSPWLLELVVSCLASLGCSLKQVVDLPAMVTQKNGRCELLWWPHCYLLWLWGRSIAVLLLLELPLLVL
jgi:hypothetical protein